MKGSDAHFSLSSGLSNLLSHHSTRGMLSVIRSRGFRKNSAGIGPSIKLACLNLGVETEARKRKHDVQNYIYLLQVFKADLRSPSQKAAGPAQHFDPSRGTGKLLYNEINEHGSSFFLKAEQYPIVWLCGIFLMFVDGLLDCLYILTVVTSVLSMWEGCCVFQSMCSHTTEP